MVYRHLLKIALIVLVAVLCISGQVLRKDLFAAPSARSNSQAVGNKGSQHVGGGRKSAAYRSMEPQKDERKSGALVRRNDVQIDEGERKSAARKLLEGSMTKQVAPKEPERSRVSLHREPMSDRKSAARRAMERTSDAPTKSAARKVMEQVY